MLADHNTARRLRTYSRRSAASLSGDLRKPCFYMHIPKCGGTSVTEALHAVVPLHRRVGLIDANATRRAVSIQRQDQDNSTNYHDDLDNGAEVYALREAMLLSHMAWQTPMIYGHVLYSDKAHRHFGGAYQFVTLLRDPVARTLSNFAHAARDGLIDNDFDAYLDGPVVRTHALSFLRFFSGRPRIAPAEEDAAYQDALRNSRHFQIIGFLDDLDGFSEQFRTLFGRGLKVFRYNSVRGDAAVPSAAQRARLEGLMGRELALWDDLRRAHKR